MARIRTLLVALACAALSCTADDSAGAGDTQPGTTGATHSDATGVQTQGGSTTVGESSTTEPTSTTDATGTADPTQSSPVECEPGVVYECGDLKDNDGDGVVDQADPECVGPCDNDESSFSNGTPGENTDCFQDCYFDGNADHEDDQCWWNVSCDPSNPGEDGNCAYTDSPTCMMRPPYEIDACVQSCAGLTPNGCDCFGCCSVTIGGQEIDVWLGSGERCSLDKIDRCNSCTKNENCGNACDPQQCELCFGETDPPPGCDEPGGCPDGVEACTVDPDGSSNCPQGSFCLTGCCVESVAPG